MMLPPGDTLVDYEGCSGCPQHRSTGAGCAVVEPGSKVALDAFIAREPCFLKDWLSRFADRFLSQRPRSLLEPTDLVHDVFTRLLADATARSGGFSQGLRPFLAYLRSTAARCAIEAERREHGRVRCGNCRHYAAYSSRCLKDGHAWTHLRVGATQDPRLLLPKCESFRLRRAPEALAGGADEVFAAPPEKPQDSGDVSARVLDALVALAEIHPRAALVVRARLLEGKTYERLADLGASVRTLKRDYALGIAFLRQRLGEWRTGMSPGDPSGRSEGPNRRSP